MNATTVISCFSFISSDQTIRISRERNYHWQSNDRQKYLKAYDLSMNVFIIAHMQTRIYETRKSWKTIFVIYL